MNAPISPSDFDATESSRPSEAFAWIDSDESPEVTDATWREVLPQIAAELRDRFSLPLSETVELLRYVTVDCETRPPLAEIEQIAQETYSADRKVTATRPVKRYASKLEAALDHARRGFSVFPLLPNSKRPPSWMTEWQFAATRDEAKIREWFEGNDYNIAITMDGFAALDIDKRKNGYETFQKLAEEQNLGKHRTLLAKTATDGAHTIYRVDSDLRLKSGNDRFGQGIDFKTGPNHYLVAAGSEINGNFYTWANDRPIAFMPKGLIEIAQKSGKVHERSKAAGKRLVEEDDHIVERAEHWINEHAPEAEQGNRDNTAFKVAARLYDFGVSKVTAHALLSEWNETRCSPPLEADEIERIASSAERNRSKPIGPNPSGFEPVEIEPRNIAPKESRDDSDPFGEEGDDGRFRWITAAESAERATSQSREWLVESILHRGAEAVLIGKPGSGKSFFVLEMLYRIAADLDFGGYKVFQGPVVYVAAEAQGGVHARLGALKSKYGPLNDVPLFVISDAPDLSHGLKDARALVKRIKEIEVKCGRPVELVVIDTLNRAMAGGDENSSKDMGAVLNAVRHIRAETGAASLVVHHPGWKSDRARGHSSVFGAVDTEMRIVNGVMTVEKLRDGQKGKEIAFDLKPISIGMGPKGERLTSCYVEVGKVEEMQTPATGGEAPILEAARTLATAGQPITVRNISEKLGENESPKTRTDEAIRSALAELVKKNWLEKGPRKEWLIRN